MAETKYKKLTDDEIVFKTREFRDDCEMGNADLFTRMAKAERFAQTNDQWDPEVRAYRELKGKFCLTIPLIKPQINQVVGSQVQNPKDILVSPERSGSSTGARIMTKLAKHAMDTESAVFEETRWFESGLSSGVGFIAAIIDRHEDPKHGNLTIEHLNEFECGLDPNCISYDINSYSSGAKYFIWEPWVDKDLIHAQYPKKVDDLSGTGEATSLGDTTGFLGWLWGGVKQVAGRITGYSRKSSDDNIEKYKYRVTHTWWRRPKRCVVLYIEGQPDFKATTLTKDSDILHAKKLATLRPEEVEIEEVVVNVMCHTIRVGDVMLEHNEDELNGVTRFPIGVYSAYFANGYRSGMAEDMIGTQEEINWGHSQNLMVVKHMSTYHWKMAKDKDGKFAEWLEANADEDNLVIDESRGGGKVEKSQSRPYLGGLDKFVEMAKQNLKLISNVRTEDPSFDQKNMSGKAIIAKQLNSQTGQASVFHNYDYSLSLFARLIVEIIRANEIYSEDEIREIVEDDELVDSELMAKARDEVLGQLESAGVELPDPPQMQMEADPLAQQEDMILYTKFQAAVDKVARPIAQDMLLEEIQNLRRGRYNTKVIMSSYAPMMKMAEQSEYIELNKVLIESGHPPLARKHLIEASDVKNKEQILQEEDSMQAAMMQAGAGQGQGPNRGAA